MARKKNISAALRKRNLRTSEKSAVLKKGMELPINTLVVVAIAVIVILAIAAFFMGGFGGSSKGIQNMQAFKNSCSGWTQTGCAGTEPSDVLSTYQVWQPNVDFSDPTNVGGTGLSQTDYLKQQCGCYGGGAPNPTTTTTGSRSGTGTATTCKGAGYAGCVDSNYCQQNGGSPAPQKYDCKSDEKNDEVCCVAGERQTTTK